MARTYYQGREIVVREAEKRISSLVLNVREMIKGSESEALFHFVYFFPDITSSLAQKGEEGAQIVEIDWLKAMNGLTLGLNRVLPEFLPLKPPRFFNLETLESSFKSTFIPVLMDLMRIGRWSYIIQNRHIDSVSCEGEEFTIEIPLDDKVRQLYHEYLSKAAVDPSALKWTEWAMRDWGQNRDVLDAINARLIDSYGFTLNDIKQASIYLDKLRTVSPFVQRREIYQVFTGNIRFGRADKLFNNMIFGREKPNLYRSPLIPQKNGSFLMAKWVFSMPLHFESWIRPILDESRVQSIYASYLGGRFEDYLSGMITPLADSVERNHFVLLRENPEIKPWLDKLMRLRLKRRGADNFEIDILVERKDTMYVVSCKGAKKELPKLSVLKLWADVPPQEITQRIQENKDECAEISIEADCIKSCPKISQELGLTGKRVVPVIVYSSIQPLSIPDIQQHFAPSNDTRVVTPEELVELLTST